MPDELSVSDDWRRIEARVEAIAPALLDGFAPGLTSAEIAAFEDALGLMLPADYAASLREHAGMQLRESRAGRVYAQMLFTDFIPLPPPVVLERRAWLSDGYSGELGPHARVHAGIQRFRYDPAWIPVVARDEDGAVFECIDTAPAVEGDPGQIVSMCTNDPDRFLSAPSFGALLHAFRVRLESSEVDIEMLEDDRLIRLEP